MLAAVVAIGSLLPAMITPAMASGERSLYIHYTHTKETQRIVFKRNGRYVQQGLDQLNVMLRDWRRNEPAKMDPALFDLMWEVYQEAGATQPIHVVSAYRSPQTNAMLASNSSGVAENSMHMRGKAIDFYIPGVPVAKLREIGFRKQIGGVGFYPSSGSPFVHLDTGSVRAWPRMTTAQLQQIFPDGRTLHIPSNGQVLSQAGYQYAQAEWQRCNRVPCGSGVSSGSSTQVADGGTRRTLWDVVTGGNNNSTSTTPAPQPVQVAAAPAPAAAASPAPAAAPAAIAPVQTATLTAPTPPARPGNLDAGTMVADAPSVPENIPFQVIDAAEMTRQVAMAEPTTGTDAPLPPSISRSLAEQRAATPSAYAPSGATLTVAAIQEAPVPQPRPQFNAPITASVEPAATIPATELPMRPGFDGGTLETAVFTPSTDLDAFAALFEGVQSPSNNAPNAATLNAMASLAIAPGALFAPEIEDNALLSPAALSSTLFAFAADPASPGVSGAPQGSQTTSGFAQTASLGYSADTFGPADTIWVRYSQ